MRIYWLLPSILGVFGILLSFSSPAEAIQLQSWQFNASKNRLTFTTDEEVQPRVQLLANPTRLVIDLPDTTMGQAKVSRAGAGAIKEVRIAQFDDQTTRIVIELNRGYTLNPQQVQVRGMTPFQWTVELPDPQRVEADTSPLLTPVAPPVSIEPAAVAPATADTSMADTLLEGVRVTPDGFFFRTSGKTPEIEQQLSDDRRQLRLDLKGAALSNQLTQRELRVDRYGVSRIQLTQAQTNPPVVRIILNLATESPEWQATVSDLGGIVLVPANGAAIAAPGNRISQSLTPITPTPSPPSSVSVVPPNASSGAIDLPNVGESRVTVAIDPGHGGRDPGAVGIAGLQEKNVVLPVAQQVAELLEQQGVQAILTRQDDREIDLEPRVQTANRANADLFVSIHANAISLSRPDINGVETYYYSSAVSRQLAQAVQTSVSQATGMRSIGVKEARFYVLRRTTMPAILVEIGFVTGREDAAHLAEPAFQTRIAEGIASGILQYIQRNLSR